MANERCLVCGLPCDGWYHGRCAKMLFGSKSVPSLAYSEADLNEMATRLISSRTSVPGVQAKLSVHLENETGDTRLTLVGLEGEYILKLPSKRFPELPEGEHFAMSLASACGIETAKFGLVRLASGSLAYLTRRMDREGGIHHMEDFCQLTGRLAERKYYGSYEQIGKAIRRYSSFAGADAVKFYEVVLFSFIIGNSDMHLKNFSLIRSDLSDWQLSKAYDLVPVKTIMPEDRDELALTLNGKKRKLGVADFASFAGSIGLTTMQSERANKRILAAISRHLGESLSSSFLSDGFKGRVSRLISDNAAVLG